MRCRTCAMRLPERRAGTAEHRLRGCSAWAGGAPGVGNAAQVVEAAQVGDGDLTRLQVTEIEEDGKRRRTGDQHVECHPQPGRGTGWEWVRARAVDRRQLATASPGNGCYPQPTQR